MLLVRFSSVDSDVEKWTKEERRCTLPQKNHANFRYFSPFAKRNGCLMDSLQLVIGLGIAIERKGREKRKRGKERQIMKYYRLHGEKGENAIDAV